MIRAGSTGPDTVMRAPEANSTDTRPSHATGKEPTDIARHKQTLPVLYAFEHPRHADGERLAALWALGELAPPDVTELRAILERAGAREYTRAQARDHRDRALASLDAAGIVRPEARAALQDVIFRVIDA